MVNEVSAETIKELEEDNEIENMKKIEAALFLSARFLNLQELVMLTDINPLMLKELISKLIDRYNKDDSAMEILHKENMWKMDVKKEYVKMINKLATGNAEFSKAEQETLAVIAYKQPVKQSVIIKIRGNKAYDHVKHFIDIGLVQARKMGHTKELKLSDDFFEYFHLQKKGEGAEELDSIQISEDLKEKYELAEKEVEEETATDSEKPEATTRPEQSLTEPEQSNETDGNYDVEELNENKKEPAQEALDETKEKRTQSEEKLIENNPDKEVTDSGEEGEKEKNLEEV